MRHPLPAVRCGLLLLLLSALAHSSTISPGIWYEFGFDPNHFPLASGCQPADPSGVPCPTGIGTVNLGTRPWTFTSRSPVEFTITDGLLAGDSFQVFDLGSLVGSTPPVAPNGHSCGLNPRVCVLDPEMSHASFLLPAGGHSITVSVHAAQILGEGFFRFDPVPEPSTFLLLASGLALAGCLKLRGRRFALATHGRVPWVSSSSETFNFNY